MGMPLTIQIRDNERIEQLKKKLGAKSKIEVLRLALQSLEADLARTERLERLKKAVQSVKKTSAEVNREFQTHSLLKRDS